MFRLELTRGEPIDAALVALATASKGSKAPMYVPDATPGVVAAAGGLLVVIIAPPNERLADAPITYNGPMDARVRVASLNVGLLDSTAPLVSAQCTSLPPPPLISSTDNALSVRFSLPADS